MKQPTSRKKRLSVCEVKKNSSAALGKQRVDPSNSVEGKVGRYNPACFLFSFGLLLIVSSAKEHENTKENKTSIYRKVNDVL